MVIQSNMNTRVMTPPYLRDAADKEAVIQGIEYMRGVLSKVENLTWITPTAEENTATFVNLVSHLFLNNVQIELRQFSCKRCLQCQDCAARTTGRGAAR